MTINTTVAYDVDTGVADIHVRGHLDLEAVADLRAALAKCFAWAPEIILVDLDDLTVSARTHLTVFAAALHAHQPGPPPVLALHSPSPEVAAQLRPCVLQGIAVFPDRTQAQAAAGNQPPAGKAWLHLHSGPTAVAAARALVTMACDDWRVPHLHEPATVIVSELVSNAIEHAGTPITLTLALRSQYLHLDVADGDRRPAVLQQIDGYGAGAGTAPGAGLRLVDIYAAGWGNTITDHGKTVWATLRARPCRPAD
jgi:anti-anti-sigma regulatory factor